MRVDGNSSPRSQFTYSNLFDLVALRITVISFSESIPKRESYACLGTMVGLAVPIADVVDSGSGINPYSPQPDRIRIVLDLRGGA